MMKTTKCSTCTSVSQVWTDTYVPPVTVTACDHCKGQWNDGSGQRFTVGPFATRTQFTAARRPI
jgi:hypothetical protein